MIEAIIGRHLLEEFRSGDPKRVRQAVLAEQANEKYGLGNWCWSTGLSGSDPGQSKMDGKVIPLAGSKVK